MKLPGHAAILGIHHKKIVTFLVTLLAGSTALSTIAVADTETKHNHLDAKKRNTAHAPHDATKQTSGSVAVKAAALSAPVTAPPSGTEMLYVTGTRLTQSRLTNVMAGSTLSADQLQRRGYLDLGLALLRENPAVSVGDNSPLGTQSAFGAGQSFVSLLNLGSQRTLTLVDGMRMGGGATASIYGVGPGSEVDISALPTSLIKSIDTRLGGAGAAYGADAVAGVINYELDDHYKGVSLNAQGDWSQKLDNAAEKIAFKAGTGFDHDRGGLVFDLEYRNQAGMLASDRPDSFGENAVIYHRAALGQNSPYTFVLGPGTRYIQNSLTGMPTLTGNYGDLPVYGGLYGATYAGLADAGIASANGTPLVFSQNGQSLVPFNSGTLLKGDNALGIGGDGLALRNYIQMRTPSDRLNLTLLGHYDLTDHLHATWQGWYARGSSSNQVNNGTFSSAAFDNALTSNSDGPQSSSYFTEGVVNGPLALSTDNPYLTSTESSTIKNALAANGLPTDQFYLNRLNQDLDTGYYRTTLQMFRFQGGLHGDFRALNRDFKWKTNGEYTRYTNVTTQPSLVIPNLVNALNAVRAADGTIECAPGYENAPIATRSAVCAPLNPFGYNQMSQAARDYVTAISRSSNRNTQRDLQAEISSTVFRLPAGAIRWDLGYEHRREAYHFSPGTYLSGWEQADGTVLQYGNDAVIPATGGAYHTHEGFGELDVPLVSPGMHMPGIYHLSLTANGRLTYNSITGAYWTYMAGASWWPMRDFGLSGNYAVSVRNPSVGELYSPRSTTYESGTDPCSSASITSGPNPALRAANCAKAGLPRNFTSNFESYSLPGSAGGNAHLRNEHSRSFTGSLEFRPHFIRGFDMKASFVDVKVADAITYLSASNLLAACYDSADYESNPFCSTFRRNSSGQITSFQSGYYNIASYETQALQTTLDYILPLRRLGLSDNFGTVDLQGNYVHYLKSQQRYLSTTYLLAGSTASPKDNFTLNTTWQRGALTAQWQTMWYGPSLFMLQVPSTRYEANKRPAFAQFNLSLGYEITKNLSTNFVINNITDALPKDSGIYNLTRYYEALIGRSFQMRIGASF
ncbi:TonB-dependent receptor [Asaia siamensis]|uniref:TonB-dependent receptor n=1 Tax=Asaia siamensis TaxID=110479 RepID=A0ABQ1M774_9PROT|nr:TonB-dependent receptor [Asaia siamensis]GBR05840.1 TonB-dependent outer membrane receptor [Asaia siamensis NRIC 0323]GGC35826.1 TonB-dependent receptor [Asaia siamensis]